MRCPHCGQQLPRITQRTPWHTRNRARRIIGQHSGEPARRARAAEIDELQPWELSAAWEPTL